jgi:hypothetical protein
MKKTFIKGVEVFFTERYGSSFAKAGEDKE